LGEATDRDVGRLVWLGLALVVALILGALVDRATGAPTWPFCWDSSP
jgi:hypothetical protein